MEERLAQGWFYWRWPLSKWIVCITESLLAVLEPTRYQHEWAQRNNRLQPALHTPVVHVVSTMCEFRKQPLIVRFHCEHCAHQAPKQAGPSDAGCSILPYNISEAWNVISVIAGSSFGISTISCKLYAIFGNLLMVRRINYRQTIPDHHYCDIKTFFMAFIVGHAFSHEYYVRAYFMSIPFTTFGERSAFSARHEPRTCKSG